MSPPSCECALEALDGPPQMRTRLRVGSVSGFLDAPIQYALAPGNYTALSVNLHWVKCPQDAAAVMSMLNAGLIDMALMFTEDAVAFAAGGSALRICGTFASSPRVWGLHVSQNSRQLAELESCTLGIPDENGAVCMLAVLAERPGWEALTQCPRRTFNYVRRAREAMGRDFTRATLWEKRGARGYVDCGDWAVVCEEAMPWPALVFVASKEALYAKAGAIQHFIHFAHGACEDFKGTGRSNALNFISTKYELNLAEATEWLNSMSWDCACEVDEDALARSLYFLQVMGLVPADRHIEPLKLLAREICILSQIGSTWTTPYVRQGQEEPEEEDEDFGFPPEPTSMSLQAEATSVSVDASESGEPPEPDARSVLGSTPSTCLDFEPVPAG